MESISCEIERRGDGALLVRVPSPGDQGQQLPDAVFAFRAGDPQFKYWEARYQERCPDSHETPGRSYR